MIPDLKDLFKLDGKVAIVTGAGSGLGEAIAQGYAQYGATVVIVDVNEEGARRVSQDIVEKGGHAMPLICDVVVSDEVRAVVSKVINAYGKIDILVNNAGISRRSKAEEMTDEMWGVVIDVNLKGPFCFSREVGRHMIRCGKGGRIINIASVAGLVGLTTGNANYSASKGGLIAMTRCMAIEWAKHNVLVNAIAPSHFRTPLDEKFLRENPEIEKYFLDSIPLGRRGELKEIVGPAIFLASEAASFATGHVLLVDGGHTAK